MKEDPARRDEPGVRELVSLSAAAATVERPRGVAMNALLDYLEAGADVLFADVFGFGSSLAAASRALGPFLARGGRLGWGLVPTDAAGVGASREEMVARWRETETSLVAAGLDRDELRARSLLTPACGCGTLRPEQAVGVFARLRALRARLREEAGGGS